MNSATERATKSFYCISPSSSRESTKVKSILVLSYEMPAHFSIYFHALNHTLTSLVLLGRTLAHIP